LALTAVPDDAPASADPGQPAKLRFFGMSTELDNPPKVGDVQTFTVTARCTGYAGEEQDSGWVLWRKMRVLDVQPGKIVPAPVDPQLKMDDDLFAMGGVDE
jgi:hypothetical protein